MVIHDYVMDTRGSGRWELSTTRYVPVSGGSRSRLPIGFEGTRRYFGFVGIDEKLTQSISTIAALYNFLGGGMFITTQDQSYVSRLLEQSKKWIRAEPAAE